MLTPTHTHRHPHPCRSLDQTHVKEGMDLIPSTNTPTLMNSEGTDNQVIHSSTENDDINNITDLVPHTPENIVIDVYTLDESGKPRRADTSSPFQTVACLHGPKGECVRFLAMVDNGAMINMIDSEAHSRVVQRLSPLQPSN